MTPAPTAIGLFLCEQVIVDRHTGSPSPINVFTGMAVERFPSEPRRLSVFAALTDGLGSGTMAFMGNRLDTGDRFFARQYPIHFPDRGVVVNIHLRIRELLFPVAGWYEFQLLVDGDLVGQRKLKVYQTREANP